MTEHEVVIAGGGPTGMMLAGELALAGVEAAIIERRLNQEVAGSRAGGLLGRALEELDQRGIVERFVSQGQKYHVALFPEAVLDTRDLPSRHNYSLRLRQAEIERTLADWVAELGVETYRGAELTD